MNEQPPTSPSAERIGEILVFAPIGLVDLLRTDGPRLVAEGWRRADHRVRTAHMIGRMAVTVARAKLERQIRPARPAAPVVVDAPVRPAEPFAGYDSLPAADVVAMLERLGHDELAAVAAYEAAGRGRRTVLSKIDQLTAA